VVNGERSEDWDSDGIRYLITLSEPTVGAADGKRYNYSYQRTEYRTY
jgi:hypothetical protein